MKGGFFCNPERSLQQITDFVHQVLELEKVRALGYLVSCSRGGSLLSGSSLFSI
jgi:hypothetical protein